MLKQTNAVFYPTAITSLVAACVGAALLLRVLIRLNRSASISSQSRSEVGTSRRSEVGKIVMGYMVSLFLAACIPGVVQMVTVLLMRGGTSVELQGIVCWPLGFSLYFFLLNGHLWSMGLAARIYMTLLRLAPDEKKRKRGQKFLSWLTLQSILFYSLLINTGYALLVTIYSASSEPHQFVVVGGGCWSGAPSQAGDWIIMTPMVCFLTVELWLFKSARKIVNAQGAKIPELVSSTFWEVLQFTGAVLFCDVLLCATLVCDHSYRLSAENPSTEVVSALVTIETITISVYPMTVALLFLLTSSSADGGHALADKRIDKGRFVVFTQQASDGSGELWRAAQETLIQQREGEMEGLCIPKIQDWKEENADELPFRFIHTCMNGVRDKYDNDHDQMRVCLEDEEEFDGIMWECYDAFTEEQIGARPRRLTGYRAPNTELTPPEMEEDDSDEEVERNSENSDGERVSRSSDI